MSDSRLRMSDRFMASDSGFRAPDSTFRASDSGYRTPDSMFRASLSSKLFTVGKQSMNKLFLISIFSKFLFLSCNQFIFSLLTLITMQ